MTGRIRSQSLAGRENHRSRVDFRATTDNELMLQVRDGDISKLGILFERHHVKLYNFLVRLTNRRDTSEDMVQDVFVRIMKYGQSFRGEAPFTVWMYQLARNAAADHFRKWKNEIRSDGVTDERVDEEPTAGDNLVKAEQSDLLKRAMALLSAEKREVLILSRYQELKYEEIGAILDCPVGTVKARVHRALQDLKREYEKLSHEKL